MLIKSQAQSNHIKHGHTGVVQVKVPWPTSLTCPNFIATDSQQQSEPRGKRQKHKLYFTLHRLITHLLIQ